MEGKKVQQILVYTDFTNVSENAIKHAVELTKIFNAELNIIHVIDDNTYRLFKKKSVAEQTQQRLETIKDNIYNEHGLQVKMIFDEGCACTIINSTAEKLSAVLIIIGIHPKNKLQYLTPSSALKIIRKSRIPYISIHEKTIIDNQYKNILLPINHLKESKEKISWAAFFGKNNNSLITILLPKNPDEYTHNNLKFAKKFLTQFDAKFEEQQTDASAFSIDKRSIELASTYNSALTIIMNKKKYGLIEYIFGAPEKRFIGNKNQTPVLSLNPRDDLYVPCV